MINILQEMSRNVKMLKEMLKARENVKSNKFVLILQRCNREK